MAIKNLSKKLAILTLSLTMVLPVCAEPACMAEDSGFESYSVSRLIRPCLGSVTVTIEERLHSTGDVIYRGKEYREKEWISFLVRNLLIGPDSVTVTDVEFRTTSPDVGCLSEPIKIAYKDKETQKKSYMKVYISEDRSKLSIVCNSSISETAKNDIVDWRKLVTNNLFFPGTRK